MNNLDTWDPRQEDYTDKNFNSYDRGPGKNIPKDQDKSAGTQLYITGIPHDLSNKGLDNLFSRAGNVLHANVAVSKQPNSKNTYGFVTMENLIQAEDAIRQLQSFKLGGNVLRVRIAMSKEEKLQKKKKQMEDEEFLNSLPSNRINNVKMKGSDSDSDRGSIKSLRSRNVAGYGNTSEYSMLIQQNNSQGKFEDRPSLLGPYPGLLGPYPDKSLQFKCDGRVIPDPFLIQKSTRNTSMNDRFIQLEEMEYGGQYQAGFRGRGRGRGLLLNNYQDRRLGAHGQGITCNRYENYGRGNSFHRGGFKRLMAGYGQPNAFGDNINVGYYGSGYGRGSGDYQNYRNVYGQQQWYEEDYQDSYCYNIDQQHYNNLRQQTGGYRGKGLGESLATNIESLAGFGKERTLKKVKVETRPCQVCCQPGSFQCSRCKTPYCCEKCQRSDWESHKHLCKGLSNGTNIDNDFARTFEGQFEISVGDDMTEKIKTQVEQTTGDKITCNLKNEDQSSQKRPQRNVEHDSKQRNKLQSPGSSEESRTKPQPQKHGKASPKQGGQVNLKSTPESVKSLPNKPPIEYSEIPINTEIEVMVAYATTPDHFAVELLDIEMIEAKIDLMGRMNKRYAESLDLVQTPELGMIYAVQFSDKNWYRARVDSIEGRSVGITYIDYGNTENILIENLRVLTPDMMSLKAQAIICELDGIHPIANAWPSATIDKLKTLLVPPTAENPKLYKVIAVSKCEQIYKVKITDDSDVDVGQCLINARLAVKRDRQTQTTVSTELNSPLLSADIGSVSSILSEDDKVNVLVTAKESPTLFYGQIVDDAELINKFHTLSRELKAEVGLCSTVPYRPFVGELVVAKFKDDDSWYRAEVLSISSNGVICNFVDFGNSDMIPFSSVQRASALCRMIPKVAVKLKLFGVAEPQTWTENTQSVFDKIVSMDNPRVIQMEVKSLNSDIVEVDFVDDSGRSASDLVCESMVLRQASIPETDDFVLASSVPLETIPVDGTQIEMMISEPMLSLNKCYLQKAIPENVQIINLICEEINSYCMSNSTPYHPIRGELVCAQFPADNVWYRAEVLEVDCDSYKVQFVDYGSVSVNSSEGLRKILKSIMAIPRQAVCCTLAGVDLSTLNTEQSDVFKASFIETIVKAEAHEMINESYSTTFFNKMDGTKINNLINSCRTIESTDIIMASTLSTETIPVDGNHIEALVMECYHMKYIYVQIVCEKCILQLETITAQLQEFCHSKSSCYVPMKGELVCALFVDDYWYRAEVLEVNGDDFTVFFVDYGNQANVKSSAIRKISSSLAITPKQSVCCNMVGVDFKKLTEEKILEFSKKLMNSQVVRLQGLQKKDGYYDVYLFSHQGENMNELLHTGNELKTEKCCEQQPSVVPASSDVLMATALPMLTLPVDGQKTSLKLTDPTNLENLYFQKEDKHALDLLSTQVCTYCQSNTTPYTPVIGELVCALYSVDSTWYRAEVLDINEDDYLLQFFDYGNSETVKCNAIRIIDPSLITVPRLAVCCHLKGVDLTGLSEEKKLEFLTMAMSETVQVEAVGKHEHFYDVILYTSSGENINQKFLSQDMIEEPIQETPGVIMACTLPAKSLPLDGTKSDVFITDATSMDKIYLQFYGEENQQTQTDLLIAINRYCQDFAEPYSPTKGELVCAIFEKIWYRAEVLQVTGDTFKLLYVDYGNTADVKSDLICKIDKTLTTIPMQAVCCNVYQVDLKSLSPENIQLFAELVMGGKMIRVQALELIDRYYEVKLFTVDDICINDQFPRPAKELVPSLDTIFARNIPTVSLAVGGEQVDAVITEVMDDCTFHIQADIAKSQLKLNEILGAVHQYCSTNTIPYKPVKGEMVCTQFSSDQVWYRAEVEDVMVDKYCVQYVDFGNREIVTEAVIRKIDPSLTKQPIQSVKCCLFDIPSANEVKTALISLKEVEINIKVVKKENEIYHVVIYTRNNIDIIEPLLYSTKAISDNKQIQKSVTTNTQFLCKDDAEKMQPKGDSFDVVITHVVSPVEIFCQLADPEAIESLAALMQSIMCRCEIEDVDKDFRPQVGQLVCAYYKLDGGWYRGCVTEVYPNDTFMIHYSDFGNSEVLNIDQIRSMLQEYLEMPLLAIKCSLSDLSHTGPSWGTAATETVNLFKDRPLTAHVVKKEEDVYVVDLIDENDPKQTISVSDILMLNGHAKRSSESGTGSADNVTLIQQQITELQAQLATMGNK